LRIGLASDFMTNQEILKEFEKKIRFVLSLEKTNKANKIYFRKIIIKAGVSMEKENGEIICSGELSGVGVDK